MADPFTTTILKLKGTGFFEFLLPFIFTAAVFYGLLRKSQIFGPKEENVTVNAVIALTAAFMVWAYPVLSGVSFVEYFPAFFVQATSAMLVIMIALMISSMFLPPDLPKLLGEKIGGRGRAIIVVGSILIGGSLVVTSGMINLFFPGGGALTMPEETLLSIGVIIVLVISVLVIVALAGAGGTTSK